VKNRWIFSNLCFKKKKNETYTLAIKICILQENGFKELALVLFESLL
jgi:hypothetical protein